MPKTQTRLVGAVAALLAAGLAGFSLRSSPNSPTAVAARNPAPDVRTQVIRRTVHIVRHQRSGQGAGLHGGGASAIGGSGGGVGVAPASSVRTHASGSHAIGSAGTVAGGTASVTTRTSASHSAGSPVAGSGSPSAPVTTRTSASHSARIVWERLRVLGRTRHDPDQLARLDVVRGAGAS